MEVGSIQASSIQRIVMVLGACRGAPWVDKLTPGFGNTTGLPAFRPPQQKPSLRWFSTRTRCRTLNSVLRKQNTGHLQSSNGELSK